MSTKAREVYDEMTGRKYIFLLFLTAAVIFTFFIDIMTGPARLSFKEVSSAIFSLNSSGLSTHVIVRVIRLPTALMAVVVGDALGITGAEMQTILDNSLASLYTLGISAATGFGAALALVLGVSIIPYAKEFLVPINAFIFSLLSCLLVYFIARARKATSETIVLAGIALLFLFHSLVAFLQYMATEDQLQRVVFWLFGSLSKATWHKVGITSVVLIIITILFAVDAWKLTALRLGDNKARSLGVDVEKLRLKVLIYISILTATAVCFVGTIGFIGLVAPHIARMFVGEDQRFFLPSSALVGAILLSTASIGSKLIIPGALFPIGIVTSFIGVPFFLLMILTKRRSYW